MIRIDRVSNARAANAIIVVGLVSVTGSIVGGLLNAYSPQYYQSLTDPSLRDRLQTFLNVAMNSLPFSALVVAAGFALRTQAQRTQPVAGMADTATPPVPGAQTPVQVAVTADRPQAPIGDDIWRR